MTSPQSKKKPYESPAIESESVVETSTLACGKCLSGGPTGSGSQTCKQARKYS